MSPKMSSASRRQALHHGAPVRPISAAIVGLLLVSAALFRLAASSPPVDYFVYTSQLTSAQPGSLSAANILPSLESIYSPLNETEQAKGSVEPDPRLARLAKQVLELIRNQSHSHDNDQVDLEVSRYAWHLMERQARLYMRNRVLAIKPFIVELVAGAQVSGGCERALAGWLERLVELDWWASLMWNSWGDLPPSGLFEGSFTDLGSYRGCLRVPDNELIGESQFCTIDLQPLIPSRPRFHSIFKQVLSVDEFGQLEPGDFQAHQLNSRHSAHDSRSRRLRADHLSQPDAVARYAKRTISQTNATSGPQDPQLALKSQALIELANKAQYFYYVKFRLGACLPSRCSADDVRRLAETAGHRAILQTNSVRCMTRQQVELDSYQKSAMWILGSLALVALLGTLIDLLGFKASQNSNSLVDWLLPFSLWTNGRKLFAPDGSQHSDLGCVHGLRVLSMVWVIYGHTILYTEYQAYTHFFEVVERQVPSLLLLPTLNANFSVDTFFVISGILTTYVTWEYTKGDARRFNKFAFLISRYIRLTPQLGIVILCFYLLPLLGDGPIYRQVAEAESAVCQRNWLINLLYLQSYLATDKHCIDPSWWLSIEMTFHVLSVLVIGTLIHNVRRGMLVNFLLAAGLTIWGAAIHYSRGFAIAYLPSIPQRYEVTSEQTALFFHRPYPHAASYFIGVALGYVLATRSIKKLTKAQVIQGWTLCGLGLVTCLWSSYFWNLGAPYNQLQATIYYNLCQLLWPVCIGWIILACSLGHGGLVNSILSARCFAPFGRVTYMTYLSHSLVIYYHSASMNVPVEPSVMLFIYLFLANALISLLLGIILTVLYESPILNLQKQFFAFMTLKFDPTTAGSQLAPKCQP